jgi:ribosomal protein S18 acetylase RimI-like enzyme
MSSTATMARPASEANLHVGVPGLAVAIEAAALLNASLGSGFITPSDLTGLGRQGLLVRARGKRGQLLGAATARVLDQDPVNALQAKLRAAGISDSGLGGYRVGEIKSSAVIPAARGRGIGTQMLKARLEFLKGHGCRYAVCASWISSDINNTSIGLLEKAGFAQLAAVRGYWADEQTTAGYSCPDCGRRCTCTAAIMVLDLKDCQAGK